MFKKLTISGIVMQSLLALASQESHTNLASSVEIRKDKGLHNSQEIKSATIRVCTGVFLDSPCGNRTTSNSQMDAFKPTDDTVYYMDYPR